MNKKSASRQIARSSRTALAHASALIFLCLGQALISRELAFDNRANDDNARSLHEDREQNPVANLGRLGDRGTLEFWAVRSRDREENEAEEQHQRDKPRGLRDFVAQAADVRKAFDLVRA